MNQRVSRADLHRIVSRAYSNITRRQNVLTENAQSWVGTERTSLRGAFLGELCEALRGKDSVTLLDQTFTVDRYNQHYRQLIACVRVPDDSQEPSGFRYFAPSEASSQHWRGTSRTSEEIWQVCLSQNRFVRLAELDWRPGALQVRLWAIARIITGPSPQPAALIRWYDSGRYRGSIINIYDGTSRTDIDQQWDAFRLLLESGHAQSGRIRGSGALADMTLDEARTVKATCKKKLGRSPKKQEVCAALATLRKAEFISDATFDNRLHELGTRFSEL